MIQDKLLQFSEGQAVTDSAASTNAIEVGGDEVAQTLNLCVQVTQNFATLTSLAMSVETCDTNSSTANDWTTLASFPAVARANLVVGARPWGFQKLPYGLKKWVRVKYTVSGSDATAGKVDAFLTPSLEIE